MSKLSGINISPLYEVEIPSTGEKVKFRAYNVKEEKALLTADESQDGAMMVSTLQQIILNCITPTPEHLTSFDLEYLFAQIRAKSVGEIAVVKVGCDAKGCEDVSIEYRYDLTDMKVIFPENKKNLVRISDTIAVKMRYPSVEDSIRIEQIKVEHEKKYQAIVASLEYIYIGEEAIRTKDEPAKELMAFIDTLTPMQYRELEKFFEDMPYTEGVLKYRCTKCKKDHVKKIHGLINFFS